MTYRIIVTGKNRNFSVLGMPALLGGASRRAEGSFDQSSELPANTGVQPASGPSAELMDTKTAKSTPTATPEAAPAVSGTRRPACRECGGCGWNYDHYICPLSHVWTKDRVTCSRCGGDGYEVNA